MGLQNGTKISKKCTRNLEVKVKKKKKKKSDTSSKSQKSSKPIFIFQPMYFRNYKNNYTTAKNGY